MRYARAMSAVPLRKATYEEYLALERDSETKHEYVNGEIYAMAGGTPEHGRLAAKLARLVGNALAKRPCEDERSIETYRREGKRWIYEAFGPGEVASVAGADVTLAVDELYASALEAG